VRTVELATDEEKKSLLADKQRDTARNFAAQLSSADVS